MKNKRNKLQSCLGILFIFFSLSLLIGLFWLFQWVRTDVRINYGQPATNLNLYKKIILSTKLYFSGNELLFGHNDLPEGYYFEILPGESVGQISYRLKMNHLINDAQLFNDYLVYRGFDRKVQSGYFLIEPEMTGIEIAEKIINPIPDKVRMVILPGWRLEEIAAILPRSGLDINSEEFTYTASNPSGEWLPANFQGLNSLEGFLFPGEYVLNRNISTEEFLLTLVNEFSKNVTGDILQSFYEQGLSVQQAIILASLVEREAVNTAEMPLIASVFLNRYSIGMKLDSDPTVQYAVGYNVNQATWWTNPLSRADLQTDSPFNTYLYTGLPPHPICNPSLNAIKGVAFPEETSYFYFRAKCDGSGNHNFSETYEEHLNKACP